MVGVEVVALGRMPYLRALEVQRRLGARVRSGGGSALVLVEHPPTYTTGLRSKVYTAAEEQRLLGLGADFVRTNRGGLITFHGPGQLVAYPILDLRQFAPLETRRKRLLGMKWYVERLEQVVIDLLATWRLQGVRSPHTGVWVATRGERTLSKVCAIGVHSADMVTSHGLALNCTTDMAWFQHIVPCGITEQGTGVTSLASLVAGDAREPAETTEGVEVARVGQLLVQHFEQTFQCQSTNMLEGEMKSMLEGL